MTTVEKSKRKPHNSNAGYVCELKCRLGGHIVIYDNKNRVVGIDTDSRWIVAHEPSRGFVQVGSLAHARHIMKGIARADSISASRLYADILSHADILR